jgi:hypothetical protein
MNDVELAELVARIGCLYTKRGLSPPFRLRDIARNWLGLTPDEVIAVLEKHFPDCRRFYTSGAGEQQFNMVRTAISKAIEAKHPPRDHADDELERPWQSRKRTGPRKVYTAGGYADVIVDREDGDSIGEDAEAE